MQTPFLFPLPAPSFTPSEREYRIQPFRHRVAQLRDAIEWHRRPSTQAMTYRRAQDELSRLQAAHQLSLELSALLGLIEAWKANAVPASLVRIKHPNQLQALMYWQGTVGKYQFNPTYPIPDAIARIGINTPELCTAAYHDLIALIDECAYNIPLPDQIRTAQLKLAGYKIQGFFPTLPDVVRLMLDYACLHDGERVLEPSAGWGNIADAIREEVDVQLTVIECNYDLHKILAMKGYQALYSDFLDHRLTYDAILMNPPFEKGQDMAHVRYAYELLNPGGRLVAIMSEGTFSNSTTKFRLFRDWLDEVHWDSQTLWDDAFNWGDRPTKVRTRLVYIQK